MFKIYLLANIRGGIRTRELDCDLNAILDSAKLRGFLHISISILASIKLVALTSG